MIWQFTEDMSENQLAKRRITQQQVTRIKSRQQQAGQQPNSHPDDDQLGPEEPGLVLAHYGAMADVEAADGRCVHCLLRQHLGILVPGDQVVWRASDHNNGVIVARKPRYSLLGRPDPQGEIKPIAANIDQMLITIAPEPAISTLLIDSYLVASELLKIQPLIILNKIDLITQNHHSEVATVVQLYSQLGYSLLQVSVKTTIGLKQLQQALRDKTNVFVGQSGVGKSSLIDWLLPQTEIRMAALTRTSKLGTHTTSTAHLYHLPQGGALIDSPGIRSFGLWQLTATEIARGFIELKPLVGQCKFRNCAHQLEPHCALQQALKDGVIARSRFENFKKLIAAID